MTDEKMLAQREELRALQDRYPKMTLLHGTELNIDPEGNVDWAPSSSRGSTSASRRCTRTSTSRRRR